MIYKIAQCPEDMIPLNFDIQGDKMIKMASGTISIKPGSDTAKIIESEIKKHPTALFFRAKAIKANEPNSNGDYFSEEELIRACPSFVGVPFFTNHDNQNVENARGKIIFAEWVPEEKAIYTISFVDREAYPHICRSIEEEYITGVSMGALNGESLVAMSDLSEKKISEIEVGDEVLTPYNNKKKVKLVHSEYLGKPMYSFDLVTYHKTPMFTNDHPIYTIESSLIEANKKEAIRLASNSKYNARMGYIDESIGQDGWRIKNYNDDAKFVHADCVKEGDFMLVPSKFKIEDGASVNSDFYYIVGAYLGDGYLKKDKKGEYDAISFCIGLDEIELAKKITDILKKYSKSEPYDLVCENRNGLYISLYDRKLAKWFADNIGSGSKSKRIKFNLKFKEDALNLLAGYLDTDGCVANKVNKNHTSSYQFSSANLGLLEDVQSLLIALGCVSIISSANRIPGENSVVKVNTIEHTLSAGSNNSDIFGKSIKFAQNNCNHAIIKAGRTFIVDIKGNKFMACPVKNIYVENFNEPVYDLTVEDDECYIADGVAVHNCAVEYSVCNICGNKAEKTEDYCAHIRERKGRTFSGKAKNVVTGEVKEFNKEPVFEYNYGIKFIELSAVVDPACPSCRIQGLIQNDEIMKKVANIQNSLYMIKTSAIEKHAGQEEITQLNEVLKTLEGISIKLIQNRQQVEVEFASDLVGILSDLQTFVDELIGAGYGNVQPIPGVAETPPAAVPGAPTLPPAGLPPEVQPVASETPLAGAPPVPAPAPAVGTISGAPTSPLVKSPKLPITAPVKPRAFDVNKMQKVAKNLINLIENANNKGENDMSKRLTVDAKLKQKKAATEVLSNSWKEKQDFFEYIDKVPSVQDNSNKLSVKKRDDSFIIVAENKIGEPSETIWTYEMLSGQEKEMIKENPKTAATYFLDKFATNLKNKKGEAVMTNNIKEAGAKSVNKAPEVITEAQLEEKGLYHSRTDEGVNQITEKQLDEKRSGEKEVITEAQLNEKSNKLSPRTGTDAEVITEAQLDDAGNVSPRSETPTQITQAQLEPNRTGTDPDVITEKQLSSIDSPWARAAKRNSAMFKSAGDHMKAVIDVMANTVISTGCTPEEATQVASTLVGSTKDRYDLGNAILDTSDREDVDYSKRLAYWSKKNIKVAGVGTREIAHTIVSGLQRVASDVTINPEVIIDALDVVSEGKDGSDSISKMVDQKLASAQKETIRGSKKEELRKALKDSVTEKESRENERKAIVASLDKEDAKQTRIAERAKWSKKADTIIETDFNEVGCKSKDEANFKSTIKSFARGALASQNIKLAAITNVTISGDTISIAVQTDAGEQGVEIPVGEEIAPATEEIVPEADVAGEGLEANLGLAPVPAPAPAGELDPKTGLPKAASSTTMKKQAQIGGAGGGIPGTPGAVTAPGAPEAGLPGAAPVDQPVQALTTDEADAEIPDEIPTAGQQQPLCATCPECGSSDVDVTNEEGSFKGTCNACGAEYEGMIKKEVEFKIIKPTRSVGAEEATGAPEAPEVPALPVAAQTRLDKGSIVRISSNQAKNGHVCPACGMKQCKASVESDGHTEYKCPACNTDVQKDVVINVNNPEESYLRVKWDLVPNIEGCSGCKEAVSKFASMLKVQGMIKQASNGTTKFPMANCIERVARKWGGNSVASFGPCKGKPLADCVCGQLEKLGLNKVRHMEKLASVYIQKDPMDECVEDQMKNKYERKEAETICKCLKKKFASQEDDNVFLMAFADDIKSGKEKILTAQDLDAVNDLFKPAPEVEEPMVGVEEDIDIGAPIDAEPPMGEAPAEETVTIEISEEAAQELADAAKAAVAPAEVLPVEEKTEVGVSSDVAPSSDIKSDTASSDVASSDIKSDTEEKDMAIAMQTHKIMKVGEEIIKVAATPTVVKDIEGNVEAKVPRSEQKLGDEAKADSLLNKPNKSPEVPRKDAYMGKEKEADSLINKELKLPDVAVDSAFMGHEKEVQKGMPAINNEIKGTVIAKDEKTVKEAKKMKEVDTVEKDVEAKVPRNESKLGEEAKADSLINEPNKGPEVPRSQAYMGEEKGADSLINKELSGPDVPIDNAYMGHEKEVQKGMPGINDEMLKNVQQKRDIQLERIATARRMKAVETAAKLLATKRIPEEAYENVIEALSKFEIDKIASVADNMYPRVKKVSETQDAKEVYAGPAIIMESKEIKASNPVNELSKKLASSFTIGSQSFDKSLTQYGEK